MNYEYPQVFDSYYQETDPDQREKIFSGLKEQTDREEAFARAARELFDRRHTDPKRKGQRVDTFLWNMINLVIVAKSARVFARRSRRETLEALASMEGQTRETYGEEGTAALYWEYRNAARRYFATTASKGYGRKVFGIIAANEEDRKKRSCADAYEMSIGLARRLALDEEMALFSDAVRDEYSCYDAAAAERLEDYAASRKDKDLKRKG